MSGICAVWRKGDTGQTALTLASVTGALSVGVREETDTELDGDVGLGVCARWTTQQLYRDAQVLVACDADLCEEEELWEHCAGGRSIVIAANQTAALIARLYDRWGCDCVEKLRGSF